MISMITEEGTTKIKCIGDIHTLAADSALLALNAFRLYAEYTSRSLSKQTAYLDLMQIVLQQLSKEEGGTE